MSASSFNLFDCSPYSEVVLWFDLRTVLFLLFLENPKI